jgi:alpha-amylase
MTLSEAVDSHEPVAELDIHHPISWADLERDLSAWLGNRMQHAAIRRLYELEAEIKRSKDKELLEMWRRLSTSDHFYYMCTKWFSDGDVHKYFNPYDSPYDGFIAFMNVLNDIVIRLTGRSDRPAGGLALPGEA